MIIERNFNGRRAELDKLTKNATLTSILSLGSPQRKLVRLAPTLASSQDWRAGYANPTVFNIETTF